MLYLLMLLLWLKGWLVLWQLGTCALLFTALPLSRPSAGLHSISTTHTSSNQLIFTVPGAALVPTAYSQQLFPHLSGPENQSPEMLFIKYMDSQVFPSSSGSDLCDLHVVKLHVVKVPLGDSHDQANWGTAMKLRIRKWDGMKCSTGMEIDSQRKKVINKIMSLRAAGGEGPC